MISAQTTFELSNGPESLASPVGYTGLYAFHKYWGKKPAEPIAYLIRHLCPIEGLVVDPFMGSGVTAIEAIRLGRRVIGIDVNPVAVRLARMLVEPPSYKELNESFNQVSQSARERILATYGTTDGDTATHYIWNAETLTKVWRTQKGLRKRVEADPTDYDLNMSANLASYQPKALRKPRFFTNSRINSKACFELTSLFTGRALHNIEVLMNSIAMLPTRCQEPLLLSLTAAVGQMSSMVFTITGRGKANGSKSERVEVGSWVIGFWKPEVHFEVNVWNCFERRVKKLLKAVHEASQVYTPKLGMPIDVCLGRADLALIKADCISELENIPDHSVDLIVTDPPHGDRIPYLELSELWNVILGEEPDFQNEIVVSNAKERGKDKYVYNEAMRRFLSLSSRKLKEHGYLVLFFNARTESSWTFFDSFKTTALSTGIVFVGSFPLIYSAGSVVQDNREGALQTDFGLIFSRSKEAHHSLPGIPGWSSQMPIPQS